MAQFPAIAPFQKGFRLLDGLAVNNLVDLLNSFAGQNGGSAYYDFYPNNVSAQGNVTAQQILSNYNGIGYTAGAGGTATQGTSRTTGVTLNKVSGAITTNNSSLGTAAHADFVVTDSVVNANDVVVVNIVPGGTGEPRADVVDVGAGSFTIRVTNDSTATADTSTDVINFAVIKVATT